jgi:hypothetical protein
MYYDRRPSNKVQRTCTTPSVTADRDVPAAFWNAVGTESALHLGPPSYLKGIVPKPSLNLRAWDGGGEVEEKKQLHKAARQGCGLT